MQPFLYPSVLEMRVIEARFPRPLGEIAHELDAKRVAEESVPVRQEAWKGMTDVLARFGRRPSHPLVPGHKKLWHAAHEGRVRSIDAAVDAGNEASLRHGLPIATIDADRVRGTARIAELRHGTRMDAHGWANADVGKLPGVVDDDGPIATPVAVAARATTTAETQRTLSIVWAPVWCAAELEAAVRLLCVRLASAEAAAAERALPAPSDDPVGRALLDAILAEPDRDDARLVFADWLEVQGGMAARRRAQLIRGAAGGAADWSLGVAVAQDVGLDRAPVRWTRGFVSDLAMHGDATDADIVRRLRDEPVTAIGASHGCRSPLPATARALSLWSPHIGALEHPAPHRLRHVQLSGALDAAGWAWLASLTGLERLRIHTGADDPWRLATAAQWPALATLQLQGGFFTPETAAAIPVAQLAELELKWCRLDDATLARIPRPRALRSLTLAKDRITTLAPFEGAPLRSLSLWDMPLGAGEAARICAMTELEALHVSACPALERPLIDAIDRGALPALRRVDGIRVMRLPPSWARL